MARGRKPTPKADPEGPDPQMPAPPAWLDAEAKREWRRVGKILLDAGIVTLLDRPAMTLYCNAWSAYQNCTRAARADGPIVNVNGQPVPNPYIAEARRQAAIVHKLAIELGLTPSARRTVKGKAKKKQSALAELLGDSAVAGRIGA